MFRRFCRNISKGHNGAFSHTTVIGVSARSRRARPTSPLASAIAEGSVTRLGNGPSRILGTWPAPRALPNDLWGALNFQRIHGKGTLVRILYLSANPEWVRKRGEGTDGVVYERLNLNEELRGITNKLFDARQEGAVHLEVVPEATPEDVVRYTANASVNVLHFSGHGDEVKTDEGYDETANWDEEYPPGDPETEKYGIILSDEFFDGQFAKNSWLKETLRGKNIDVALLNCCWSEGVAKELQEVVGVVIGTSQFLPSDIAYDFAVKFYDRLQKGQSIKTAFEEAVGTRKGLYKPVYMEEASYEKVLDPEMPPVDTPAQQLLGYRARVDLLRGHVHMGVLLDLLIVVAGTLLALGGHSLLEHISKASYDGEFMSFLHNALQESKWLKYEPYAVMCALISGAAARLSSFLWIYAGSIRALCMFDILSVLPERELIKELAIGRVQKMVEWLEGLPGLKPPDWQKWLSGLEERQK